MPSSKLPKVGDLCWSGYWREFYVEIFQSDTGERTSLWLGDIGGEINLGFGNARKDAHVTEHRTPFDVDRDEVVAEWGYVHGLHGDWLALSYDKLVYTYRLVARKFATELAVRRYGMRVVHQERPRPIRRPQYRPTPY